MKSSYLTVVDDHDKFYIFNALSGALMYFPISQKQMVNEMLNDLNYVPKDHDTEQLFETLKKSEFIVENREQEMRMIANRRNHIFLKDDSIGDLNFSIAPTLKCNLNCSYCYQTNADTISRADVDMSESTQEKLLIFIKNKYSKGRKVGLGWYGGEPLLGIKMIENVSRDLISHCGDDFIGSGMASNGTLLTKKNIEMLASLRFTKAQITIDGDVETHDKRRPFINGTGTYNLILDNVQCAIENGFRISIRINIDNSNKDSYLNVLEQLSNRNLTNKVNVSCAVVRSVDGNQKIDVSDDLGTQTMINFYRV
ncbi:MAG: radical SAM protein [Caldisericales bacterium]|nr:radical SAM protein [Caldisericales bacterium]